MKKTFSNPVILASFIIGIMMLVLTAFEPYLFNSLSLDPTRTTQGEYWRILTANLVHFGWAHTLMNTVALVLCTVALLSEESLQKYLWLLLFCCLAVGLGIFWLNPEYNPYAGLSGAIHGLIVAGLLQTRAYPLWIKITGLVLISGKLVQENLPGYEATDLQQLIPAAVAVESHVYGAIAGAVFALGDKLIQHNKRKN